MSQQEQLKGFHLSLCGLASPPCLQNPKSGVVFNRRVYYLLVAICAMELWT